MGFMNFFKHRIVLITLSGNTIVRVHNKKEAQFYAEQSLKHCYESRDLVNKTKNPRVFFERYDYLIAETDNLKQLEYFLKFKGRSPSETFIYLNQIRERETNTMIRRVWEDLDTRLSKLKTKRGKENTINKLFEEFKLYKDKMTKSNIDLCNLYYTTFMSNI